LGHARSLAFTVPAEGATHIHFDAAPLCSAVVISKLVHVFGHYGPLLKKLVKVNPNCVRLGPWPTALSELTASTTFMSMNWPEARTALGTISLSKYCDYKLLNIVLDDRHKHTFEVRVLPSTLDASEILDAAALFEALIGWCADPKSAPDNMPSDLGMLFDLTEMTQSEKSSWQSKIAATSL